MATNDRSVTFADLAWGEGRTLLEVFLEPTCPHSGRAFSKLMPLLDRVGQDRLTVRIWLNAQPWHTFSSVVSRAVLAASGEGGRDDAWRVMAAVYDHREDYVLTNHSQGPNLERSPSEVLRLIADHSGLDLREAFERKEVTDRMKRHARYSRQNGIHATPTFMVDGLVTESMSSGDEVEAWVTALGLAGE